MKLHQYQSLLQRNFLLFLTEWYFLSSLGLFFFSSSFFFFFLPRTFYCFWFFHEQRFLHKQRDSMCEFCKVHDVNKCGNNIRIEPKQEWLPWKFPQGDSPRSEIMTSFWYCNFYLKICFFRPLGCFQGFLKFFHGNICLNVWIQLSQIDKKSIFFGFWRWEVTLNQCQQGVNLIPVIFVLCSLAWHFTFLVPLSNQEQKLVEENCWENLTKSFWVTRDGQTSQ